MQNASILEIVPNDNTIPAKCLELAIPDCQSCGDCAVDVNAKMLDDEVTVRTDRVRMDVPRSEKEC